MKKLVILISGRGSNMEAIVRACASQRWPASVAAVISNRPDAAGLTFATTHSIATVVVDHMQFDGRDAFNSALIRALDTYEPDLVVLAGFMRILTPAFVKRYSNRMMNVHPSLLPSFTGLNTHQRALDRGVTVHGATVHFVTAELDYGPIIAQGIVPVLSGDTADVLAARVLRLEHELYPRVIRWFIEDQLRVCNNRVELAVTKTRLLFRLDAI
ncbi:phosphoribosylglycinamide formyltransferase [Candidatus Vallotia tarda]|uniref:Phosphoribosylglycinamide formyltransferase n=1 Tax=Candidatus Vallotiella hemipterorum TaxID=1177213 RepID=A0A916NF73_9BURK|nr:phosphoribosylglycinamide formyltransferase [Candidatus Vallotia tarda]CAG7600403.1 Phosphoribosylglycinamide formyltransferase [Candidatus Vallotia tarda]